MTTPMHPTSAAWDVIAAGWHRWTPRMREWYAPVTDLMLELARIGPGDDVLDVAAGDGDQSLAAVERVGPGGRVLAVDAAAGLLAFARRSAHRAGVANLETRIMAAEDLRLPDGSFDAVICRFGLMLFDDPDGALAEMNRVLRRHGRAAVVVFGPEGMPELTLALSVVRRRLGLPEQGASATRLGSPGRVEAMLHRAGFDDVDVRRVGAHVGMASAAEAVRYLADTSPTLGRLTAFPTADREETLRELERVLGRFESSAGFDVTHDVLVAAGTADRSPSHDPRRSGVDATPPGPPPGPPRT